MFHSSERWILLNLRLTGEYWSKNRKAFFQYFMLLKPFSHWWNNLIRAKVNHKIRQYKTGQYFSTRWILLILVRLKHRLSPSHHLKTNYIVIFKELTTNAFCGNDPLIVISLCQIQPIMVGLQKKTWISRFSRIWPTFAKLIPREIFRNVQFTKLNPRQKLRIW